MYDIFIISSKDSFMKKTYIELPNVADFIQSQPESIQVKYERIIDVLEGKGYLVSPYAEKVEQNLFAIRILNPKNIRIFYVYMKGDEVYGIHAYEKKSQKIPSKELSLARKILKQMR
jgi:phage-related protein